MSESNYLVVGSLRISDAAIEELQDGRPILSIKRSDVRSIRLCYGFLSRHPIPQIVFGATLTLFSGFFMLAGIGELAAGIVQFWTCLPIVFAGLGLWVIYDATKRGYFLQVSASNSTYKLAIGDKAGKSDVNAIVRELDISSL